MKLMGQKRYFFAITYYDVIKIDFENSILILRANKIVEQSIPGRSDYYFRRASSCDSWKTLANESHYSYFQQITPLSSLNFLQYDYFYRKLELIKRY